MVEAWNVVPPLAARRAENLRVLQRDLLQRLQAVGGEAGADHVQATDPGAGQRPQGRVGRRLQPLFAPEARLERDQPLSVFERSEEHTSELQSLMRISYAVFCLKKKKNINYRTYRT